MMVELILGAALAAVVLDNIRLRFKERRQLKAMPKNQLPDGTLLPDVDDPRWRFGYVKWSDRTVAIVQLGAVVVMFDPDLVFVDGHPLDGKGVPEYAGAVQVAYNSRRALESITDDAVRPILAAETTEWDSSKQRWRSRR